MKHRMFYLGCYFFWRICYVASWGPIDSEEIPTIVDITTDTDSINIFLKHVNPEKKMGPLFLTYKILGVEKWCENISLIKPIALPVTGDRINITSVSPFCTYCVTLYFSREKDDWQQAVEWKKCNVKTKAAVFANKIEDLRVVSKGKDHFFLRWLPPSKPNGVLKTYLIKMHFTPGYYLDTYTPMYVRNCFLWPKYKCYEHQWASGFKKPLTYHIKILGVNSRNVTEAQFDEGCEKEYCTMMSVFGNDHAPSDPYDINATWFDYHTLNVSWKHPNETNGELRLFEISTNPDNISHDKYVRGEIDYSLDYEEMIDISDMKPYPRSLGIRVKAKNQFGMSNGTEMVWITNPPSQKYGKKLCFNGTDLFIEKPDTGPLFDGMYIFIAEAFQDTVRNDRYKRELEVIELQLQRPVRKNTELCRKGDYNSDLFRWLNGYFNGRVNIEKYFRSWTSETTFNINVFIVNHLHGNWVVTRETQTVSTKLENTGHTDYTVLYIFVGLLFALLCVGYLVYRCRRARTTSLGEFTLEEARGLRNTPGIKESPEKIKSSETVEAKE